VLNLGHTVAVTQNFVSSVGLPKVLDFLKPGRTALVSGCGLEDRCVYTVCWYVGGWGVGGWGLTTGEVPVLKPTIIRK
jgi:hypothetical protein